MVGVLNGFCYKVSLWTYCALMATCRNEEGAPHGTTDSQ